MVGVPTLITMLVATLGISFAIHRAIHGREAGLTPLAVFLLAWSLEITLCVWNPFRWNVLSDTAMLLVTLGLTSFVLGYAYSIWRERRHRTKAHPPATDLVHRPLATGVAGTVRTTPPTGVAGTAHIIPAAEVADPTTVDAPDRLEYRWRAVLYAWRVCTVLWMLLFVYYVTHLGPSHGGGLPGVISQIRSGLRAEGAPSFGFYFFYFAQISVPLGAVLVARSRSYFIAIVSIVALVALALTSNRTNILLAFSSAVVILLLSRRRSITGRRVAILGGILVVGGLIVFNFLGDAVGKTYGNSALFGIYGPNPPVPAAFATVVYYFAGPLPYLDVVMHVNSPWGVAFGAHVFRPIFQLLAVVLPVPVVPNSFDFLSVPYPTNIGSYMAPLYLDYGWLGVVAGSFAFGFGMAFVWRRWRRAKDPIWLVLLGVVTVFGFTTLQAVPFAELWFVILIVVLSATSLAATIMYRRACQEHARGSAHEPVVTRIAPAPGLKP